MSSLRDAVKEREVLANESRALTPHFSLTKQQQTTLKEELLKMILKDEEAFVRKDSTIAVLIRKTELLSFIFIYFLETFPLFKGKPVMEDLELLVSLLPPLSSTTERNGRSTKRDSMWKRIKASCTWIFHNMLTIDETSSSYSSSSTVVSMRVIVSKPKPAPEIDAERQGEEGEGEVMTSTATTKEQQSFIEDLAYFVDALKNTSGLIFKDLFTVLKQSTEVEDLPPKYRNLLVTGKLILAHHLRARLGDSELITKIKQICRLTPVRLLKVALRISSPGALIDRVLSLFLARVVGAPNIIQQLYRASSKLAKTESLRNAASQLVPSQRIQQKLQSFIEAGYSRSIPHPSELETDPVKQTWMILVDTSLQPVLTVDEIRQLSIEDYASIRELLKHEVLLKDKQTVYDFLGDAKVIELLKRIVPVIHIPLVEIISKVDMGAFLDLIFTFLRQLVVLAEEEAVILKAQNEGYEEDEDEDLLADIHFGDVEDDSENASTTTTPLLSKTSTPLLPKTTSSTSRQAKKDLESLDITHRFEKVVADFVDSVYKFLHTAAVNDSGTLESLVSWLVERLELIRDGAEPLDLHSIISTTFSSICTFPSAPASSATPPTRGGPTSRTLFQTLLKEIRDLNNFHEKKQERKEEKLKDLMKENPTSTMAAPPTKLNELKRPEAEVMQHLKEPFIQQVKARLFSSVAFQTSYARCLEKYSEGTQPNRPSLILQL